MKLANGVHNAVIVQAPTHLDGSDCGSSSGVGGVKHDVADGSNAGSEADSGSAAASLTHDDGENQTSVVLRA